MFGSSLHAPLEDESTRMNTMSASADAALQAYFRANLNSIESWFNVIAPKTGGLPLLQKQLAELSKKDWAAIIGT